MASAAPAIEVTPDLATPASELRPEFPLPQATTGLVLYPGGRGELRVRWHLQSNDFVSYGAGFPLADGRPEAVLRLQRLQDSGGSETLRELPLPLTGLGGDGDLMFTVGEDYAGFEAELGLTNAEGGWLSLIRSNRMQHATGIGLEGVDWEATRRARAALIRARATAAASAESPQPAPERSGLSSGVAEVGGGDARLPGSASPEPRGLRSDVERGQSPDGALGIEADHEAAQEENATLAAFPIPALVYGSPTPEGTALVVEAELHVRGWGTPNSEIELFGHPYRIGPGGRFELVLKVDDPKLLREALAQHPPLALGNRRED